MATLNKRSTIEEVVQYLINHEAPINSPMFDTIARNFTRDRYTADELRHLVHGKEQLLTPCTPNTIKGPLSTAQKIEIHTYHQEQKPTLLARHYKTSYQNICLAQRNEFSRPKQPDNPTRPYGPLTVEEKEHIRDNHADDRPSHLARTYNTSMSNIIVAQRGTFTGRGPKRLPRTQVLKEAAEILGVSVETLERLAQC
jgi:hypothetical protein